MTTREELKDAFNRLSRVRESLYELDLDEPITILDKNEAGILFNDQFKCVYDPGVDE